MLQRPADFLLSASPAERRHNWPEHMGLHGQGATHPHASPPRSCSAAARRAFAHGAAEPLVDCWPSPFDEDCDDIPMEYHPSVSSSSSFAEAEPSQNDRHAQYYAAAGGGGARGPTLYTSAAPMNPSSLLPSGASTSTAQSQNGSRRRSGTSRDGGSSSLLAPSFLPNKEFSGVQLLKKTAKLNNTARSPVTDAINRALDDLQPNVQRMGTRRGTSLGLISSVVLLSDAAGRAASKPPIAAPVKDSKSPGAVGSWKEGGGGGLGGLGRGGQQLPADSLIARTVSFGTNHYASGAKAHYGSAASVSLGSSGSASRARGAGAGRKMVTYPYSNFPSGAAVAVAARGGAASSGAGPPTAGGGNKGHGKGRMVDSRSSAAGKSQQRSASLDPGSSLYGREDSELPVSTRPHHAQVGTSAHGIAGAGSSSASVPVQVRMPVTNYAVQNDPPEEQRSLSAGRTPENHSVPRAQVLLQQQVPGASSASHPPAHTGAFQQKLYQLQIPQPATADPFANFLQRVSASSKTPTSKTPSKTPSKSAERVVTRTMELSEKRFTAGEGRLEDESAPGESPVSRYDRRDVVGDQESADPVVSGATVSSDQQVAQKTPACSAAVAELTSDMVKTLGEVRDDLAGILIPESDFMQQGEPSSLSSSFVLRVHSKTREEVNTGNLPLLAGAVPGLRGGHDRDDGEGLLMQVVEGATTAAGEAANDSSGGNTKQASPSSQTLLLPQAAGVSAGASAGGTAVPASRDPSSGRCASHERQHERHRGKAAAKREDTSDSVEDDRSSAQMGAKVPCKNPEVAPSVGLISENAASGQGDASSGEQERDLVKVAREDGEAGTGYAAGGSPFCFYQEPGKDAQPHLSEIEDIEDLKVHSITRQANSHPDVFFVSGPAGGTTSSQESAEAVFVTHPDPHAHQTAVIFPGGTWTPAVAKDRSVPPHEQASHFERTLRSPVLYRRERSSAPASPEVTGAGGKTKQKSTGAKSRPRSRAASVDVALAERGGVAVLYPPASGVSSGIKARSVHVVAEGRSKVDLEHSSSSATPQLQLPAGVGRHSEGAASASRSRDTSTRSLRPGERADNINSFHLHSHLAGTNPPPAVTVTSANLALERTAKVRNRLRAQLADFEEKKQRAEDCRAEFAKRVKHLTRTMTQMRQDLLTTPTRKRKNEKSLVELGRQKREAEESMWAAVREWEALERRERECRGRLQTSRQRALSAMRTTEQQNPTAAQNTPYLFAPEDRLGGAELRVMERSILDDVRPAFGTSTRAPRRLPNHPSPTSTTSINLQQFNRPPSRKRKPANKTRERTRRISGASFSAEEDTGKTPTSVSLTLRDVGPSRVCAGTKRHWPAVTAAVSGTSSCSSASIQEVPAVPPTTTTSSASSSSASSASVQDIGAVPSTVAFEGGGAKEQTIITGGTTSEDHAPVDARGGAGGPGESVLKRLEAALAAAETKLKNHSISERISSHRKKWR